MTNDKSSKIDEKCDRKGHTLPALRSAGRCQDFIKTNNVLRSSGNQKQAPNTKQFIQIAIDYHRLIFGCKNSSISKPRFLMQTKMLVSRCWSASHLTMPGPVAMESHHALAHQNEAAKLSGNFQYQQDWKGFPKQKTKQKM